MADSSSESEQSFDIDNIHEDNREHVREVLAKGKEIIPYYSVILFFMQDAVLFELYKKYYQTDQVFYNELNIIKNRTKQNEGDQEGWVTVGKDVKNKNKNRNKASYNFLEDKECNTSFYFSDLES